MVCEEQEAFRNRYEGVILPPPHISKIYGVVFHRYAELLCQTLWNRTKGSSAALPADSGAKFVKWVATGRLPAVLDGREDPRGGPSKGQQFAWLGNEQRQKLTPDQAEQFIQNERGKMIGRMYLALEAIRREFLTILPYTEMQFEVDFGAQKELLWRLEAELGFRLKGQIDRLQFLASSYEIMDYKSGWIVEKYLKDRHALVEDVQMTIYNLVASVLYGHPPSNLYFQLVEFSREEMDKYGLGVALQKRVPVPRRTETHKLELIQIGRDIHAMVERVTHPERFSSSELQSWEPVSSHGKKTGLEDNVRQGRYIPRIGGWCKTCDFIDLCKTKNREDWQRYKHEDPEPTIAQSEPPPYSFHSQPEQQDLLGGLPKRSIHYRKPQALVREQLQKSGLFLPKAKVLPFYNKVLAAMENQGSCPCLEVRLRPVFLFELIPQFIEGKLKPEDFGRLCPNQECPRKTR